MNVVTISVLQWTSGFIVDWKLLYVCTLLSEKHLWTLFFEICKMVFLKISSNCFVFSLLNLYVSIVYLNNKWVFFSTTKILDPTDLIICYSFKYSDGNINKLISGWMHGSDCQIFSRFFTLVVMLISPCPYHI